jgi:hypothetical protein
MRIEEPVQGVWEPFAAGPDEDGLGDRHNFCSVKATSSAYARTPRISINKGPAQLLVLTVEQAIAVEASLANAREWIARANAALESPEPINTIKENL